MNAPQNILNTANYVFKGFETNFYLLSLGPAQLYKASSCMEIC